jgi:cyclophilin family peptidyl-prolyl cis-trans isomerase
MGKADRRARKRDNKQQGRAEREAAAKRAKQRSGFIRGTIAVVAIVAVIGLILVLGRKDAKKAATPTTTKTKTTATTAPAPTTTAPLLPGCVGTKPARGSTKTYTKAPPMTIDTAKTYTATMTTSCGTIKIALDASEAPITVNSFVFLAKQHFYDGLSFHRIVKDFVVQGGDPKGDGTGGPGYEMKTEPPKDGYKAGSVAMANAGAGTTGSQFFLTWSDTGAKTLGGPPYLYSILGQVTSGLDVVKTLGSYAPQNDPQGAGAPTRILYIDKVTISES